ncbi:hypothetical protein [Okeania sp. KiyG1]|uniref:hypothetical protein n=1 Tax=Okeania sp. KiyG1 TaxID=2720165 RepID=UPI001921E75B|nr:hypothetical protein [Okeania sp. KiyG1]GGA58126.1 hypothetical protein CYANOKiyG1_79320 [Okeania sp. KiyG1]
MAIVRFSPCREIDSLQKEMNRVFDNFAPYLMGLTQFLSPNVERRFKYLTITE